MTNKSTFSKPPLTIEEKEKRANEIIEGGGLAQEKKASTERKTPTVTKGRVSMSLRAPVAIWLDIQKIRELTCLTQNAVVVEILRAGIKQKLDELT